MKSKAVVIKLFSKHHRKEVQNNLHKVNYFPANIINVVYKKKCLLLLSNLSSKRKPSLFKQQACVAPK